MPIQVLMPALSPSMETGRLSRWLVAAGDRVRPGDVIAEVETATATMEVEAVDGGVIGALLVAAGSDEITVDTPIATIVTGDEPAAAGRGAEAASPARVRASPLARRLAAEAGIDIALIAGSGPDGRVVKRDVLAWRLRPVARPRGEVGTDARAEAGREPPPQRAEAPPSRSLAPFESGRLRVVAEAAAAALSDAAIRRLYDPAGYDLVPHDGVRRAAALRLERSTRTIPHVVLRAECRMEEVQRARRRMNGGPGGRGGKPLALGITDFLVKALALALQQVPAANVTWTADAMLRHKSSDVAVAVPDGLVSPVIRHAELKSLSEIADEIDDLADRARRRRLAPHEYQGGSTSIVNVGMAGVRELDAVIEPPHATVLAVGGVEQRPVVVDERIEVGAVMNCSLACDARAVDAATGAQVLAAFKALVEDPLRMLV